jgi:hypothetical protein
VSFTTRILPPEEWPRLAGTEAEAVWPHLDPNLTMVLVVEHEGAIVGTWVLVRVLHAECLWIAPAHRQRTSVARHLWGCLRAIARRLGVPAVVTAAVNDDTRRLLDHVNAERLPGDHYVMRFELCQQP